MSKNYQYFHFRLEKLSNNDDCLVLGFQYFLTASDVAKHFKCCRKTIYDKINDPMKTGRYNQFYNYRIMRCKEPTYVRVANPLQVQLVAST